MFLWQKKQCNNFPYSSDWASFSNSVFHWLWNKEQSPSNLLWVVVAHKPSVILTIFSTSNCSDRKAQQISFGKGEWKGYFKITLIMQIQEKQNYLCITFYILVL